MCDRPTDKFQALSLNDDTPATSADLRVFWAAILAACAIWIFTLIRIGYWLATWPPTALNIASFLIGCLIGISAGILLIAVPYRLGARQPNADGAPE